MQRGFAIQFLGFTSRIFSPKLARQALFDRGKTVEEHMALEMPVFMENRDGAQFMRLFPEYLAMDILGLDDDMPKRVDIPVQTG